MASSPDIATLSINDFESHLNAIFEMQSPDGMVPLKLAKTESAGQARREGGAFSLLFVAPAGPFLPQAIYPVRHPALGTILRKSGMQPERRVAARCGVRNIARATTGGI